jgi:hypothetical protein
MVSSGVLDLTFAVRISGYRVANVKSTPLDREKLLDNLHKLALSPMTRRFVETTMAADKKSQRGRHGNWEI